MKTLRPYQESALQSLFKWFGENDGHPLVVAPVGAGKSLMIAEFIKRVHADTAGTPIIVLAHVKELLEQNMAELRAQYPDVDAGFYSAGLGQKRLHNEVIFATIQSIHSKVAVLRRAPSIIIIDEVHLVSHKDNTQYRKFIDACIALNPNCKVIGFTGTPFRADSGRLDEGEGRLFDGIAYEIDIAWMIENGYLCRPFTPKTDTRMSTEGVAMRGGDFVAGQLEAAVDVDEITQSCVTEMLVHGKDRKRCLVFTAGIEHCCHVVEALRARGETAEMVTGETPNAERDTIIMRFKAGDFRWLVNVAVLTTGFNVPEIDLLAFMRPTRSPVLYIQCIGRGLRTAEGKKDCMVIDFGGVIEALGAIDAIDIRKKPSKPGEAGGEAKIKTCPACGAECAPAQKYCYECGYNFVVRDLSKNASDKALLSSEMEAEWREVLYYSQHVHHKGGDPEITPTMRVIYTTPAGQVSEYVCFEHKGYARDKARKWHNERLPDQPCPTTVAEAVDIPYPKPNEIKVGKQGKYDRIFDYNFGDEPEIVKEVDYEDIPF